MALSGEKGAECVRLPCGYIASHRQYYRTTFLWHNAWAGHLVLEISEQIGASEVSMLGLHLCGHDPMLPIPIPSYGQIAIGRSRSLTLEGM